MSVFKWTATREKAAIALAEGKTQREAADIAGCAEKTVFRWMQEQEFAEEVDRLTFLTGIAKKSERLRLAKRVVKKLGVETEKDLLDWLKFAQGETDGVKLDLTELLSALPADDS